MRLTKNFTLYEFRCRCGCGAEKRHVEAIRKTAETLEALRERINIKVSLCKYKGVTKAGELKDFRIKIRSGVRCPAHNKRVGGVKSSRHLSTAYEGAADTRVPDLPVEIWSKESRDFFRGHILYLKKNFVHHDRRTGNAYYAVVGQPMREV